MAQASDLFYSRNAEVETLDKRIRPSEEQRIYLLEQKDELKDWLEADMNDLGMEVSTFIQGSYKFHTLIRPLVVGTEYDVDLGLYFKGKSYSDVDPEELRDKVQKSLVRYSDTCDALKAIEEPKERCSRVTYKKSFHIDVPVYHETPGGRFVRLATLSNGWEKSDPAAMLGWFADEIGTDTEDRAQIRRLIRYMKAWSALTFSEPKNAPSSLMLSILVVDAYDANMDSGGDDDEVLEAIIRHMYERLVLDRTVRNPIDGDSDNDVNRLSGASFSVFLDELARLLDAAERANTCETTTEAAITWSEVFSYVFPLPEDLDTLTSSVNGIAISTPKFTIGVYADDKTTFLRSYDDHVPHARVGEWLRFRVRNPEVIPQGAKVRWIVRNSGHDALSSSDLGHVSEGGDPINQTEHAAYRGKHFMDCEVWLHGRLRSLTRIPVTVDRIAMPARIPPRKPAYTRFMKKRR